jgi:hypothetical protein
MSSSTVSKVSIYEYNLCKLLDRWMFSTEVSFINVLQDVYSIVYTDRQRLLEVEVFSCTSDQVRE